MELLALIDLGERGEAPLRAPRQCSRPARQIRRIEVSYATTQWDSLYDLLVQQKQWRDKHDNADCIPDPK